MKLTITRAAYIDQLKGIDYRYERPEMIEQATRLWDELTGAAEDATLYLRGWNKTWNCHMASVDEDGFFSAFLAIGERFKV